MVTEANIENYLRTQVKNAGGMHRKVVYQGRGGSPDDWCFFPGARLLIVECKAPGEKLQPHQAKEVKELRRMGFNVWVVDSYAEVDEAISTVRERHP